MPYKDAEKQRAYLRDYFKKRGASIKREYRQNKRLQEIKLREAINLNKLNLAKQVMNTKPKLFQQTWEDMFRQKRRKKQ